MSLAPLPAEAAPLEQVSPCAPHRGSGGRPRVLTRASGCGLHCSPQRQQGLRQEAAPLPPALASRPVQPRCFVGAGNTSVAGARAREPQGEGSDGAASLRRPLPLPQVPSRLGNHLPQDHREQRWHGWRTGQAVH